MQDGKFELLLVRAPKNLLELSECVQALQKQTYNCAMLTFVSGSQLKITAPAQMPWTLDGERADGREYIEVANLHNAIQLIQKVV